MTQRTSHTDVTTALVQALHKALIWVKILNIVLYFEGFHSAALFWFLLYNLCVRVRNTTSVPGLI